MNKTLFIEEVSRRLSSVYSQVKAGHPPSAMVKHRTEGFIDAGVFLGFYSTQERDQLIEQIHQQVFGITQAQRKRISHQRWQAGGDLDYSDYDAPAYERTRQRK